MFREITKTLILGSFLLLFSGLLWVVLVQAVVEFSLLSLFVARAVASAGF